MAEKFRIAPCSGGGFDLKKGQRITVEDVSGGQVADFFAECAKNPEEFLSTAVTIDCNESLRLKLGECVYTNLYRPMFTLIYDDVGVHDLLFPSCRREMYDFFYQNGQGHPNCFDNINRFLSKPRPILQPVNLFMHTTVSPDGKIVIHPPLSQPGSRVVLRAEMDVRVAVAACSVSEGACNARHCSPIRVWIEEA